MVSRTVNIGKQWSLYVLELESGCFYVGITTQLVKRMPQHEEAKGAARTKRHPPVRLLEWEDLRTGDIRAAEAMEDDQTVRWMQRHGRERVRGGHFSECDQGRVERALQRHKKWVFTSNPL